MRFNFVIIPYRDGYFLNRYGFSVRDLMIVKSLSEMECVKKIVIVNRPVSIYERILGKTKDKLGRYPKMAFVDTTSFDLFNPIKKRLWTRTCYFDFMIRLGNKIEHLIDIKNNIINVLLDFTPFARIPYQAFKDKNFLIWYDMIDNFTKHNRFSRKERLLVKEKYKEVLNNVDLITGVTSDALKEFDDFRNKLVLLNGLLPLFPSKRGIKKEGYPYTFGFIGFITNKMDLPFLEELTRIGKVVIFGKFFDNQVKRNLLKNKKISYLGEFKSDELPEIMEKFKFGIIPYKEEKSHDGSPLKLYQYLFYNKPVLSSMDFEDEAMKCNHVLVSRDIFEIKEFINKYETIDFENAKISDCVENKFFWKSKLETVLDKLAELKNINFF